jgi:hypothetical protein
MGEYSIALSFHEYALDLEQQQHSSCPKKCKDKLEMIEGDL